jgi:hypothetical protein
MYRYGNLSPGQIPEMSDGTGLAFVQQYILGPTFQGRLIRNAPGSSGTSVAFTTWFSSALSPVDFKGRPIPAPKLAPAAMDS